MRALTRFLLGTLLLFSSALAGVCVCGVCVPEAASRSRSLTRGSEALRSPELLKLLKPLKPFLRDRNIFKMPFQE